MKTFAYLTQIETELKTFLAEREINDPLKISANGYWIDGESLAELYTESGAYLLYLFDFHRESGIADFIDFILENSVPDTSFVDVGCAGGITGLCIALSGYKVTFHDYEGLGLDFIRYFIAKYNLNAEVVPYGMPINRHTVAIALDVIEHTAMHSGALEWLTALGDHCVITYPLMPFRKPWQKCVDEYVDDEAMQLIARKRYKIHYNAIHNHRRFMIYTPR